MVFSSITFILLFLPIFLFVYYFSNDKFKNTVILIFSYIFYAWGSINFLLILILSTTVDYIIGLLIGKGKYKKIFVGISITINLSLLIYFKYANFFVGEWNNVLITLGMEGIHWTKVALPIGISFFTFQKITYIVDIYRGKVKPLKNYIDFAIYVALFPQLIAGPIVRFHEISDQIKSRTHTLDKFFDGVWRFSIGLGKKVILANSMGQIADEIFNMSEGDISSPIAWIGIISYSFQIYFDFSGYSDMAIGLGKMMGFKLPENFNRPYIANSITDFWRRWHITLSNFFRDYVYIPLGGNRKGTNRTYINLWIVFFLSGLWHGASWTFIIWGLYHGFFLVIERISLLEKLNKIKVFNHVYAYLVILFGWVFFRSDNISYAFAYIYNMLDLTYISNPINYITVLNSKTIFLFIMSVIFSVIKLPDTLYKKTYIIGIVSLFILIYSLLLLSNTSYNPFIYFRF